jgi:type II secretory ATPase GspE/PulE/Tfp pilus assembly ATPase PilB-like protein
LRLLGIDPAEIKKRPVYKGAGCQACHNTGYKGRLGIFEMVEMGPELRELAYKRAATSELRAAAKAAGMRTLAEDGVLKVFKGISTAEEVSRNAQIEGVVEE